MQDRPTETFELNQGDVFIITEAIKLLPAHRRHDETLAKFENLKPEAFMEDPISGFPI